MNATPRPAFDPRVIGALIVAGIIGFIAYWLLSAFAPEDPGRHGGTHALSDAATGFSGLYALVQDSGLRPRILRMAGGAAALSEQDLLVVTPPLDATPETMQAAIGETRARVLVILPKHFTMPDPLNRGWVRRLAGATSPESVLPAKEWGIAPRLRASPLRAGAHAGVRMGGRIIPVTIPEGMRVLEGDGLLPVAGLGDAIIIGAAADHPGLWIAADADLFNNLALADDRKAAAALALITASTPQGGRVAFDVMLSGVGGAPDRSLLRMAFTPPFVGLTLCLLAAALMGLWQGFVRFGPAWKPARAVAPGKAALIANSARLIAQARAVPRFAPRYAASLREAAARRLHAPTGLTGVALDRWLDRFPDRRGRHFSGLAEALNTARSPGDILAAARALAQWRKDIMRDSN